MKIKSGELIISMKEAKELRTFLSWAMGVNNLNTLLVERCIERVEWIVDNFARESKTQK